VRACSLAQPPRFTSFCAGIVIVVVVVVVVGQSAIAIADVAHWQAQLEPAWLPGAHAGPPFKF
jgi:hypothetical protein